MRIWDLDPQYLCRRHLLAEHRELHAVWNILTLRSGRGGYARHPETLRWKGKLRALYGRRRLLANELIRRGYVHRSPLDKRLASGASSQKVLLSTIEEQKAILRKKPCECLLNV